MTGDLFVFPSLIPDCVLNTTVFREKVEVCYYRPLFPRVQGKTSWEPDILMVCKSSMSVYLNFGVGKEYNFQIINLCKVEDTLLVSLRENNNISTFELRKCGKPVVINEDGWCCVWFCFEKGYASFYMNKPDI